MTVAPLYIACRLICIKLTTVDRACIAWCWVSFGDCRCTTIMKHSLHKRSRFLFRSMCMCIVAARNCWSYILATGRWVLTITLPGYFKPHTTPRKHPLKRSGRSILSIWYAPACTRLATPSMPLNKRTLLCEMGHKRNSHDLGLVLILSTRYQDQ